MKNICADEGCTLPPKVIARYADGTRQMAVSGVSFDVVRRAADGSESSVPLNEVYNHHADIFLAGVNLTTAPWQAWAAPFWSRRTPLVYHAPYREVLSFAPYRWQAFAHLINTHDPRVAPRAGLQPLAQCPCSPQRVFDYENRTIDGLF